MCGMVKSKSNKNKKKINVANTTFLNYKYLFIKEGAY